jgi:hypothetical protein
MANKKRGRGRPKGSKNKPGHKAGRPRKKSIMDKSAGYRLAQLSKKKRGPGRPRKSIAVSTPATFSGRKVIIVGQMKIK